MKRRLCILRNDDIGKLKEEVTTLKKQIAGQLPSRIRVIDQQVPESPRSLHDAHQQVRVIHQGKRLKFSIYLRNVIDASQT
jgi:hypothetical protein